MSATDYLNAPAKGCMTCMFRIRSSAGAEYDKCGRVMGYCALVKQFNPEVCDTSFSGWRPIPPEPEPEPPAPRRSLRRWLYDIFLAP